MSVVKLQQSSLWRRGPHWIREDKDSLPKNIVRRIEESEMDERKSVAVTTVNVNNEG